MPDDIPETPSSPLHAELGLSLYSALRARTTVKPISGRGLELDIDDAYAISVSFLKHRLDDGERIVGKKIGVTSKAVQDMLGVHQPDFGFLTDKMEVPSGKAVSLAAHKLIQPRAEAEIAFVLRKDLKGPGVNEDMVLDATAAIAPCFEIVDSRIQDWKIGIVDTVADNASCGIYTLGPARVDPRGVGLPSLRVRVFKNGKYLSEGLGSAVQGSPLTAITWLVNTVGKYGVTLRAGETVLSGSLVPLEPAVAGDTFEAILEGVGNVALSFQQ